MDKIMEIKKIEPYSPKWEEMANDLARSFCPRIYPCKSCNSPVVPGYRCNFCGSSDPSNPKFDSEE
jgi:hypothetical protein